MLVVGENETPLYNEETEDFHYEAIVRLLIVVRILILTIYLNLSGS